MATVLEEYTTEISVRLWFFIGKRTQRKAVYNFVGKFYEGYSKMADDARPDAEVTEITSMLRVSTHW
jgi:hypothetical protein